MSNFSESGKGELSMANYKLTITPHHGDVEGFKYIVTLSRPGATLPTEQEASYKQLSEVESALQQVGGPAFSGYCRQNTGPWASVYAHYGAYEQSAFHSGETKLIVIYLALLIALDIIAPHSG
jgi:hypothetical protein